MNRLCIGASLALLATGGAQAFSPSLSGVEKAAVFEAAGFQRQGSEWTRCQDDAASRQSGSVELTDLNGDGAPEAWIRESSVFCYGETAEAVVLLTRRPTGWAVILDQVGMANELTTRHRGWPEIEVGGAGFEAMPVYRFNGTKYVRR